MWLLLHAGEPIGITVIGPAALANAARNRLFGRRRWTGQDVNRLFCNVSRLVLDPRYRGAGIAGDFLAAVCERAPTRYVELIASMGAMSGFWRRAGFRDGGPTGGDNAADGARGRHIRAAVGAQSALSQMRYYLLDTGSMRSASTAGASG